MHNCSCSPAVTADTAINYIGRKKKWKFLLNLDHNFYLGFFNDHFSDFTPSLASHFEIGTAAIEKPNTL